MGTIPDSVVGASIPAGHAGNLYLRMVQLAEGNSTLRITGPELARQADYPERSIWRYLRILIRAKVLIRTRSIRGADRNGSEYEFKVPFKVPRAPGWHFENPLEPGTPVSPPTPPSKTKPKTNPQVLHASKKVSSQELVLQNASHSASEFKVPDCIGEAIGAYVRAYESKRPKLRATPSDRSRVGKAAKELLEVGNPSVAVIEAAYRAGIDGQPGWVGRKIGDIGKVNEPKGWEGYRQWLATKQ